MPNKISDAYAINVFLLARTTKLTCIKTQTQMFFFCSYRREKLMNQRCFYHSENLASDWPLTVKAPLLKVEKSPQRHISLFECIEADYGI